MSDDKLIYTSNQLMGVITVLNKCQFNEYLTQVFKDHLSPTNIDGSANNTVKWVYQVINEENNYNNNITGLLWVNHPCYHWLLKGMTKNGDIPLDINEDNIHWQNKLQPLELYLSNNNEGSSLEKIWKERIKSPLYWPLITLDKKQQNTINNYHCFDSDGIPIFSNGFIERYKTSSSIITGNIDNDKNVNIDVVMSEVKEHYKIFTLPRQRKIWPKVVLSISNNKILIYVRFFREEDAFIAIKMSPTIHIQHLTVHFSFNN